MRLFIAYPLSGGLIKKIGLLEGKIEKETGEKFPWIPLKNLHLTILFLGHLNYEDYLKLEKIFSDFKSPIRNLTLKVEKIDYGPPRQQRMIWLYLEKSSELEMIKNYFEESLDKAGIRYKKEEREYLPHINLARLKKQKGLPNISEKLNWSIVLNEICLFESFLKKEGAEYKKLICVKIMS